VWLSHAAPIVKKLTMYATYVGHPLKHLVQRCARPADREVHNEQRHGESEHAVG
jgi:hypothetical protein